VDFPPFTSPNMGEKRGVGSHDQPGTTVKGGGDGWLNHGPI
jgi:hypothetical protein